MKKWLAYIAILSILTACEFEVGNSVFVDPMIGTDGPGHTYPGPTRPFGMVQLGPDTRLSGWESCAGYHYSDSIIYGFSHTHLSGTGVTDYCDILLMPTTGRVEIQNHQSEHSSSSYPSQFSHKNEKASPGLYSVHLDDYDIDVELTSSQRVGFHKYKFPAKTQSNIILDLEHRDEVLSSYIKIVNEYEIEGLRRSKSWAKDQYVYFVIQFSKPFKDYGLYLDDRLMTGIEISGTQVKAHFTFTPKKREELLVKVAISPVSVEGARKNLLAEIPHWRFERTRQESVIEWDKVLDRFELTDAPEKTRRIFFTALYHTYLNPNLYMDTDSLYRGRDMLVHKAEDHSNYTLFSLWDTFRATHPLFTILEPEKTNDFIKTFLTQYEQAGILPVWELSANETGTMIAYHSVSVIADAYIKGIQDYDAELALRAMINSAEQDHLGMRHYKVLGYVPGEEECESVSKTLEYAYDDWCIAQMSHALGDQVNYEKYSKRGLGYQHVFDPQSGFMRARLGSFWFSPFDPREVNFNYTEANAWQYNFYVPQDISGLIRCNGGDERFSRKMDSLFTENSETTGRNQADITGLIGQYAHGNEPSHHIAYLYNYLGQPWKTQEYVNQIIKQFYTDQPDGLCGNEDCGQMSSWYIFSALGFYPVTPGSDIYVIGAPLVPRISIDLGDGKEFEVVANNKTESNIYVQGLKLNGIDLNRTFITHDEIISGGVLEFEMGSEPNRSWGVKPEERPQSAIDNVKIVPIPYILAGGQTFEDQTMLELNCLDTTAVIYYQLINHTSQGTSAFREYSKPIRVTRNRKLRFYAQVDTLKSEIAEALFYELSSNRKIIELSEYTSQYSAGGDQALVDKMRGARNFRTGAWQGFEGSDLIAVVDLGFNQTINRLGLSCIQDQATWIFMPKEVIYEISLDMIHWEQIAIVENDLDYKTSGAFIKEFTTDVWRTARYVRIKANNIGVCPDWHPGAGGKAWIFADELVIE